MRKKYTVIRHARLVDGTGAPAIEDAVFVFFNGDTVSDDRLVYCGDAAGYDPSITADGEVFALDLAGSTYTILPGPCEYACPSLPGAALSPLLRG